MRFLLTNDDGVDALGLGLLKDVARRLGEVVVVAPEVEQSGVGHRVNTRGKLQLSTRAEGVHALAGTPADCARVGLRGLAIQADWLVSGLNHGGNLGVDLHMSGTVAGAREAAILGVPSIAISQVLSAQHAPDRARIEALTQRVVEHLLARPLSPGCFYNVNLPFAPACEHPDIVECAPDPNPHDVRFDRDGDAFEYVGVFLKRPYQAGTDVDVVFRGHVAVSVLRVI